MSYYFSASKSLYFYFDKTFWNLRALITPSELMNSINTHSATSNPNPQPTKGFGIVLNETAAIEIYRCKLNFRLPDSFKSSLQTVQTRAKGQSAQVADRFGVSPKTIRDIWNRRTWATTTAHLWSQDEDFKCSLASTRSLVRISPPHFQSRQVQSVFYSSTQI